MTQTPQPAASNLRLMAIFAHPDDESLGTGAALARYAAEGVEITLVTATRGQRGWFGEPADNPGQEALGRMREAELRTAATALGIREVVVLDYVDGDLDRADPDQVTCELVAHIRRVRPQVVLTFGLDGAYGHPDHMAISQWTTTAILKAADPRFGHRCTTRSPHTVSKLYHMAISAEHGQDYRAAFGDLAMKVDGVDRLPVIAPDWLIRTRIDATTHWLWGRNEFIRAFSMVTGPSEMEDDLFAGLRTPSSAALANAA
jgi:LmbE family N-acetylglucosaminyl deacetylase